SRNKGKRPAPAGCPFPPKPSRDERPYPPSRSGGIRPGTETGQKEPGIVPGFHLTHRRSGIALLRFFPVLRLEGEDQGVGQSPPQHNRSKQEHRPCGSVHDDTSSLC